MDLSGSRALASPSLGLEAARAADPSRYAITGTAPGVAVRPASREEAAEALRAATRDGLGVVPWGGGVALPHEAAPSRYDVALDLTALHAIVEYEPDDLTLTAECGATIASLRAELAARGQELPLEAAHAARATLGGVLAANASGPRRRAFGSPRDRILGARYLLGDGGAARTGGKVVKNVAGYGIHRMLCGSRGALAVIVEATLKLQPAPAARVALVYGADEARLADRARWAPFARLEPACLSVVSGALADGAGLEAGGAPFAVVLGLEADTPWVAEQERAALDAFGRPQHRLEGAEAGAVADRLADLEESPGPRLTLVTADASPAALGAAREALTASGADVPLLFHASAGRLHWWPSGTDVARAAGALAAAGFEPAAARGVEPFAPALPPQVGVRAMRAALRHALDPSARFARGEAWVDGAL